MQTSEVLNRAADLVETRGWAQGFGWEVVTERFPRGEGLPVCLEGAIQVASGISISTVNGLMRAEDLHALRTCPAYRAVENYLERGCLYTWNDEPDRTPAEVIEVLRACAVIEASRERTRADERVRVS